MALKLPRRSLNTDVGSAEVWVALAVYVSDGSDGLAHSVQYWSRTPNCDYAGTGWRRYTSGRKVALEHLAGGARNTLAGGQVDCALLMWMWQSCLGVTRL